MTTMTTFDERYSKLNDAQKRAVNTTEGPVLVVAGPGSGKTELLSLRVGNILRQGRTRVISARDINKKERHLYEKES